MRAPPDAVLASRAKKRRSMQPYAAFCRAERPLLPPSLSNSERERILGERWRASKAEKAAKSAPTRASTSAPTAYPAPGSPPPSRRPVPVQRPVHPVTPDRRVAFSEQQTPAQLSDRWAGLWRAKEAKPAAAGDLSSAPALAKPSGSPAPTAHAAPTAPTAPSAAPAAPTAPSAAPAPAAPSVPLPPAAAQPDAELLVLPNGNTIPRFPRLYLTTRPAPAPAPAPYFPRLYLAPAGPAAATTSTKEVLSPERSSVVCRASHIRARLESLLDERLREELEELTSEEAMEVLLGADV